MQFSPLLRQYVLYFEQFVLFIHVPLILVLSEIKRRERIRRKTAKVSKGSAVLVRLRLNDKMAYAIYCALGMI
jgi:hypothetical protein